MRNNPLKVTAEPIENSQVVLTIEVEPDRIVRAENQAVARIATHMSIPGFRKGKAPRHIVEMMVGKAAIREEAMDKLLPQIYREAVQQSELTPIVEGAIDVVTDEPLTLKATVPVRPTIEIGDYRAIRIEPATVAIDDEQVDAVVNRLRESHATFEPVERATAAGDWVTIDLVGKSDDLELMNRENFEYELDLESQFPAPGFAANIVGLNVGDETAFDLEYPADFRGENLRGKTGHFTVKLHAVKEKRLPEFDDELAQKSAYGDTVEAMRDGIRQQLQQREENRVAEEYENNVMEAALELLKVDVPPQLLERELDQHVERMASRLAQQQIDFQQFLQFTNKTIEAFRDEQRATVERNVRLAFLVDHVFQAEGMELATDELANVAGGIANMIARGDQRKANRAVRAVSNPAVLSSIANDLRDTKVRQRLIAIARGEGDQPAAEATEADTTDASTVDAAASDEPAAAADTPPTESTATAT